MERDPFLEETSSAPPRADAVRRPRLRHRRHRASLREIARAAEVGIATLYRHFPNREALVAAVYADQVARLTEGASELLTALGPTEALRRWTDLSEDASSP